MLSEKMEKTLNEQVNAELYSSYLYLAMSAHFASYDLMGFANWMRIQAQEELTHAMKFYDFILERDGRVVLVAIETPPSSWTSSAAVFEEVYSHEQKVTSLIHGLVDLANTERDHATRNFLEWFVSEQVEEEASAKGVLQRLRLAGEAPAALFMMDNELAARVFTPPSAEA